MAVRKRSRMKDSAQVSPRGEPQQVIADAEIVVNWGWKRGGQNGGSVILEERLVFSVTVIVGIVMFVSFMYWVYAVSLMAF
jgi:hypothetical protein